MACRKTFQRTKGTAFYRLRTSAETVSLVVTLLAHGCPLPAIVVAFGYDERTVAEWWHVAASKGQRCRSIWSSNHVTWGKVQADEIRVKKQGGIVWMALAMMVGTRLWLGGEVKRAAGYAVDPTTDRTREALCGSASAIGLYRWLGVLHPAIRETFRDPVHTGTGGRPRLPFPGAMF